MMTDIAIMDYKFTGATVSSDMDGPPTMITPDYHHYKVISSEEYEKKRPWDRDQQYVVFNPRIPSFRVWHECWRNEKLPMEKRFYFNYPSLIRGYNDFAMGKTRSMPEGFSSVLSFRGRSGYWDEEGWWEHYNAMKGNASNINYLSSTGVHVGRRSSSFSRTIEREEERLKEKFAWFDHGLDLEGLKELDKWYEDLRTWKEDEL